MNNYNNLLQRFPIMFHHEDGSQEPFALFGFECDIGWYSIIEKACETICSEYNWRARDLKDVKSKLDNIQEYIANHYNKELTYEQVFEQLTTAHDKCIAAFEAAKAKIPKIAQIKEKFGTLRMYMDYNEDTDSSFRKIDEYAELMSTVTCERCGNVGETYHMRWHKTLCDTHAVERYGVQAITEYRNRKV